MTQFSGTELLPSEKRQMLQDADWADALNSVQIETLTQYFKSYSVEANSVIIEEGKINDKFCILCAGNVDVIKENNSGQKKVIQTLNPGKIFGELSFFDNAPCSASIIAKNEIKLLMLQKDQFNSLSQLSPNIALTITLNIFKKLSQRLRQTTGQLIDHL